MSTTLEPVREVDPLEEIPTLPEEPIDRRDIFLRAAELIEREGWTTGSLGRDGQGYCILGAVSRAAGLWNGRDVMWHYGQGFQTAEIIYGGSVFGHSSIGTWNDGLVGDGAWGHVRVLAALRRLANGATWEEAIS